LTKGDSGLNVLSLTTFCPAASPTLVMRESETASANWRFFRFKVARFIVIRLRVESCSRSVPFIHRLTGVPVFDADRLLRRVTSWRAISGSGAPAGTGRL